MSRRIALSVAGVVVSGGLLIAASADAQYFKGKTVTILAGFSPGGGIDTAARLYARHFGKHVAGNPKFIVKNMTGAGGLKAMNFLYEKAKSDGLTLNYAPYGVTDAAMGRKGLRFDYAKLDYVGGNLTGPVVAFARTDIVPGGLKDTRDIVKAPKLIVAGNRPDGVLDMLGRLALEQLGLSFTYVTGYRGAARSRNSVRQGETNIMAMALPGYRAGVHKTMTETGLVRLLWRYPLRNADGSYGNKEFAPEVPTFQEVHKQIKGQEPSGPFWRAMKLVMDQRSLANTVIVAPPKTNPEALSALREGYSALVRDTAYIAEAKKILGFVPTPIMHKTITDGLTPLLQADKKTLSFLETYIDKGRKAATKPKGQKK